jgi:hypothetical protein
MLAGAGRGMKGLFRDEPDPSQSDKRDTYAVAGYSLSSRVIRGFEPAIKSAKAVS